MCPKLALVAFLLLIYSNLGSSAPNNRYIRQDQYQDCTADYNGKFAAAHPECANNPGLKDSADSESNFWDLICDRDCGMPYLSFYRTQCPYEGSHVILTWYRSLCKINANGRPCYSFFNDMHEVNPYAVFQICKSSIQNNRCSDECGAQLRAISAYYGSCVSPVFNSTYHQLVDPEHFSLFSHQLWNSCGVLTPTEAEAAVTNRWRAKLLAMLLQ